ncbi:MAG: FGGY-family carbohydrate kinase [Nitrososphaeria archaeon]
MTASNNQTDDYIIAIDIGTTAAKIGLLSTDGPRVFSISSKEYPDGILYPRTSWVESNIELWWSTVKDLLIKLLESTKIKSSNIVAISMCNTCPSLIPVDKDGKALRPAILYMDQRSVQQAKKIRKKIGITTLSEIAGNRIVPGTFSVTSMLWIKEEEPDVYKRTYKFVHANGFFGSKLTEQLAIDPTNASLTGIFDLKKSGWSQELYDKIDIDGDKLPDILWPYEKVGELSSKVARELGLERDTPVVIGCADSVASALGCGITKSGRVFETTGTSTVVAVISKKPKFDTRILNRCYIYKDLWLHMGAMSTTGGSYKWFKDHLCEAEIAESSRTGKSPYEILDEKAGKIPPGSDGLLFLPYMSGERSPVWDPYARGVFFGLSLSHTKEHMIRSILEGVAYGLRNNLEIIESIGVNLDEIRASGAASKSNLWRQIKADVLNKKIAVSNVKDSTMIGCAILAGHATGVYNNILETAEKFYYDIENVNFPNEKTNRKYEKYYQIYRKAYKRFKSMYKELAILNCNE